MDIDTALANNLPCGSTMNTSCIQRWTMDLRWKKAARGYLQSLVTQESGKICAAGFLFVKETTANTLKHTVADERRINAAIRFGCPSEDGPLARVSKAPGDPKMGSGSTDDQSLLKFRGDCGAQSRKEAFFLTQYSRYCPSIFQGELLSERF